MRTMTGQAPSTANEALCPADVAVLCEVQLQLWCPTNLRIKISCVTSSTASIGPPTAQLQTGTYGHDTGA